MKNYEAPKLWYLVLEELFGQQKSMVFNEKIVKGGSKTVK